MLAAMHLLCRSITTDEDDAPDLGPWHEVEAPNIEAAATRFATDHQAYVVLVRGLAVEQVFAFRDDVRTTSSSWTWKRGGPPALRPHVL